MSKELEALDKTKDNLTPNGEIFEYTKEFKTIKQALTQKSKKELAFDVIVNKSVDLNWLRKCKTLEDYNRGIMMKKNELTQDEFELLKEVC